MIALILQHNLQKLGQFITAGDHLTKPFGVCGDGNSMMTFLLVAYLYSIFTGA